MKQINLLRYLIVILIAATLIPPAGTGNAQSSGSVEAGVFAAVEIAPGAAVEVPVEIRNARDVYALDIEIQFDPAVVSAEDADPSSAGIQMGLGEFLDPGLLLFNQVDMEKGLVRFAMSQVNPSEPKSGSGILFVIYFKGIKEGTSPLEVINLQVASRDGLEIPSSPVDSTLTVRADAAQITATPIPVQDPGKMIQLPTPGPSPTPTLKPTGVPTRAPTEASMSASPTAAPAESSTAGKTTDRYVEKPFLVQNWWIILIVLAVAAILAGLLIRSKNQNPDKRKENAE